MRRRIPVFTLFFIAACSGGRIRWTRKEPSLSYAHFRALSKDLAVRSVLDAFGPPADILREKGTVRGLTYRCEDSDGVVRDLRMVFTPEGRLEKWALQGATEGSSA